MRNNHSRPNNAISAAMLLVAFSASVAQAAPVSSDTDLFQMSEVHGAQLAAEPAASQKCASQKCASQKCASQSGKVHAGNPLTNNKFTEHVCAAHVFHPKRKAMEARARKAAKEQQCASKPSGQ